MTFTTLATAVFTDPNLAERIAYNGEPVPAIRRTASADFTFEGTTLRSDAVTFKVRVADVPLPAEGDTIVDQAGTAYTVQGAPTRTMRGLAWLIEAVP